MVFFAGIHILRDKRRDEYVKKILVLVVVLIFITTAAATVVILRIGADSSFSRIKGEGGIRIGYAIEAPYAFIGASGEVTGSDPEVAKRITAIIGIPRIEWILTEFGSLIPSLESGQFDMIAAGMFITKERAEAVLFSEPTFRVRQALLVAKGNPQNLRSYRGAAEREGVRIAVISGSVEERILPMIGFPLNRIIRVPDALLGRITVEKGLADGLALSSPTILWMAVSDQLGRTETARPFEQTEVPGYSGFGAFAFRDQDRQLLKKWNEALRSFIGTQEHRALIGQFGFSEEELPGKATTKEILSAQ
jgi:polar amino acid transport system substrate-binding protein